MEKFLRPKEPPGLILQGEVWWRDHYKWLESCGYRLRSRYAPDWVPSWQGTRKSWLDCEDAQIHPFTHLGDAIRISDGAFASLKMTQKSVHPYEAGIGQFLSSEPLRSDPTNHCVPFWDVLQVPDEENLTIIVMPLLREYDNPRFDTIGEVIEFFSQAFEGLRFMHEHHVAHRDCMSLNFMMDATPLFPEPYHPANPKMRRDWKGKVKHLTRTRRPVKYYLIDFGISRRYDLANELPLEEIILGGDKTVPEFRTSNGPCDPFATDVYYVGNMIREEFLQKKYGFEFIRSLVEDMVHDDPTKRPTMDEVVTRFVTIGRSLSSWKLRSRVVKRSDWALMGAFRTIPHWSRRVRFMLHRVPPIPTVTSAP